MEHTIKDQSEFLASLTAMLEILFKDMHLCESHLNDGKPGWRRMYERATFASIEALSFFLKRHSFNYEIFKTIDSFKTSKPSLSVRKLSLLLDETYSLADNGKPKTQKAKLRTIPNLLFALSALIDAVASKHRIVKDAGFNALKEALKIRDSLMHPKNPVALSVTDEQLKITKAAFGWVRRELTQIMKNTPGAEMKLMWAPNNRLVSDAGSDAES
jgi:hypothetical protein